MGYCRGFDEPLIAPFSTFTARTKGLMKILPGASQGRKKNNSWWPTNATCLVPKMKRCTSENFTEDLCIPRYFDQQLLLLFFGVSVYFCSVLLLTCCKFHLPKGK